MYNCIIGFVFLFLFQTYGWVVVGDTVTGNHEHFRNIGAPVTSTSSPLKSKQNETGQAIPVIVETITKPLAPVPSVDYSKKHNVTCESPESYLDIVYKLLELLNQSLNHEKLDLKKINYVLDNIKKYSNENTVNKSVSSDVQKQIDVLHDQLHKEIKINNFGLTRRFMGPIENNGGAPNYKTENTAQDSKNPSQNYNTDDALITEQRLLQNFAENKQSEIFHYELPNIGTSCKDAFKNLLDLTQQAYQQLAKHPVCREPSNIQAPNARNSYTLSPSLQSNPYYGLFQSYPINSEVSYSPDYNLMATNFDGIQHPYGNLNRYVQPAPVSSIPLPPIGRSKSNIPCTKESDTLNLNLLRTRELVSNESKSITPQSEIYLTELFGFQPKTLGAQYPRFDIPAHANTYLERHSVNENLNESISSVTQTSVPIFPISNSFDRFPQTSTAQGPNPYAVYNHVMSPNGNLFQQKIQHISGPSSNLPTHNQGGIIYEKIVGMPLQPQYPGQILNNLNEFSNDYTSGVHNNPFHTIQPVNTVQSASNPYQQNQETLYPDSLQIPLQQNQISVNNPQLPLYNGQLPSASADNLIHLLYLQKLFKPKEFPVSKLTQTRLTPGAQSLMLPSSPANQPQIVQPYNPQTMIQPQQILYQKTITSSSMQNPSPNQQQQPVSMWYYKRGQPVANLQQVTSKKILSPNVNTPASNLQPILPYYNQAFQKIPNQMTNFQSESVMPQFSTLQNSNQNSYKKSVAGQPNQNLPPFVPTLSIQNGIAPSSNQQPHPPNPNLWYYQQNTSLPFYQINDSLNFQQVRPSQELDQFVLPGTLSSSQTLPLKGQSGSGLPLQIEQNLMLNRSENVQSNQAKTSLSSLIQHPIPSNPNPANGLPVQKHSPGLNYMYEQKLSFVNSNGDQNLAVPNSQDASSQLTIIPQNQLNENISQGTTIPIKTSQQQNPSLNYIYEQTVAVVNPNTVPTNEQNTIYQPGLNVPNNPPVSRANIYEMLKNATVIAQLKASQKQNNPTLGEQLLGQSYLPLNQNKPDENAKEHQEQQTSYMNNISPFLVAQNPELIYQQGFPNPIFDANYKKQANYNTNNLPELSQTQAMNNAENANASPSDDTIELTYVINRPLPLVYSPYVYVKYKVPYKAFITYLQKITSSRPIMRSQPEEMYSELMSKYIVTEVSPDLQHYPITYLNRIVANNGTLTKAKLVNQMGQVLHEQNNPDSLMKLGALVRDISNAKTNKLPETDDASDKPNPKMNSDSFSQSNVQPSLLDQDSQLFSQPLNKEYDAVPIDAQNSLSQSFAYPFQSGNWNPSSVESVPKSLSKQGDMSYTARGKEKIKSNRYQNSILYSKKPAQYSSGESSLRYSHPIYIHSQHINPIQMEQFEEVKRNAAYRKYVEKMGEQEKKRKLQEEHKKNLLEAQKALEETNIR